MYTFDFICDILEVRPISFENLDQNINELVFDSRKINQPDQSLFFAIHGARDGHDFLPSAYYEGIRSFVISKPVPFFNDKTDVNLLFVDDTLQAMQKLAKFHREQFKFPVIGITGSNGKSIVKAWLTQLITPEKKVYQSPKSYNSQLGVALSLWNLSAQYDLAIIEAGISQPGEMSRLQKMIQPSIGIFTNIGVAHGHNFESKQQKLQEKLNLFKNTAIVIAGSEYINQSDEINTGELLTWGKKEQDTIKLLGIEKIQSKSLLSVKIGEVQSSCIIPFTDKASIENTLTCMTVMYYLGYEPAVILERVQSLRALEMRLQLKKGINECTIIDDSYSNDLGSLKISLALLKQQNQHLKKTLILSDMEGLVDNEKNQHKLEELLGTQSLTRLIWVGNSYPWLNKLKINEIQLFPTMEDLLTSLILLNFNAESILIKGARIFQFEKIVQKLTLRSHGTVLEINMNAISHNLMIYRSLISSKTKVMAMVKAFSYGSGSFEVANLLQFSNVDYLTVAFADEGVELRNSGITLPIMVLCPDNTTFENLVQHNLEPEVYSIQFLEDFINFLISKNIQDYKIHIKLDTGMHRLGFFPEEMDPLIDRLSNQNQVRVASFFTHLVSSGDPQNDQFTAMQIKVYKDCALLLEKGLGYEFIKHAANTAAISRWPESHFDMVRLGIGLYGVEIAENSLNLEQVSTLKTTVTQIKKLSKNETVGYDIKGILARDSKIATVKIGYADGYNRRFGNAVGQMKINNQFVPTIGNICMDMCMLDVTDINVREGDEVIVFPNIGESAKTIGTIPYELLVNISTRVKRVYYYE